MLRCILIFWAAWSCIAVARAEENIVILGHDDKTPPTILRVNPIIPTTAAEVGKEGWVHVRLTITASGDVSDVQLIESYPKGEFDRAVLGVVGGWKFKPRLQDGTPVADPAYDVGIAFYNDAYETTRNATVPVERGGRVRGVNAANLLPLRRVRDALDASDLKTAGENLDELERRFEDGKMSVTDIARYFAFQARYNRMRERNDATLSWARRALMLAQFLDNGKVVYGLHLEMMESLVELGRFPEALDYFDSWRKATKDPVPQALEMQMDSLRRRFSGHGHVYTIVDFDETHKRAGRSSSVNAARFHPAHGPEETRVNLATEARHVFLDLPPSTIARGPD
ncbi:MAG: energy transducer TonB [Rhodospirillaceae bacterium]|nr:energy transducer TonB [Rhodospirillaceae bacterium]